MTTEEKRLRLVIVDDEPRVSQALEREIRFKYRETDFDIAAFNDPLAYLEVPAPSRGDDFLVISDLRMPGMNGAELLERVRADDKHIRTVLLTAYSDMDDIRRAVSAEIQSLLPKPWRQASLYAEIDAALVEYRLRRENARLKEELAVQLRMAGEFQKAILGATAKPAYPRLSVAYRPLEHLACGGDYYEALELPDGRSVLLVGDVSGHGIKPALVTLMIKAVVQGYGSMKPEAFDSPSALLTELNRDLCAMLEASPDTIVAFAAAFVDPESRSVAVANAGLPEALLCAGGRLKDLFSVDGPALGFFSDHAYSECAAGFEAGDALVMYSDGVVDAVQVGEILRPGRVAAEIAALVGRGLDADGLCDALLERHPGRSFSDDVIILEAVL